MTLTRLEQSDTELLLFIHASQKERAKRIEGRRWDPKRKCWVYPKSALVHDALVSEFGDELIESSAPRPTTFSNTSQQKDLSAENVAVKDLLRERERKLEETKNFLKEERRETERLRQINNALETKVRSSSTGVEELRQSMQEIKAQLGAREFAERIKEIAKETTGSDPSFAILVDRLAVNDLLPIELSKHLHSDLLKLLEIDPKSKKAKRSKLNDIIEKAQANELLDQEAVDLAHMIRRQGNIVRHEHVHRKTYIGRVYLSLLAAALLWPHLPE